MMHKWNGYFDMDFKMDGQKGMDLMRWYDSYLRRYCSYPKYDQGGKHALA
jgi:hypothetical protein